MEDFEWDVLKAQENVEKHGVSFEEAATAWDDPVAFSEPDDLHSWDEQRYWWFGRSAMGQFLLVVYVERPPRIRLVSARGMTRREQHRYEDGGDD